MVVRKVKFEYYEVACKEKNEQGNIQDHLFDLQQWIDRIGNKSLDGRTYDYYQEQARLERIGYDNAIDLWFLNFVRLRVTNIPLKGKISELAEPIELEDDEFIGEDVTALYDPKLNIIMLQRNIHSLGPTGIEKYINLAWANENEDIYLRPIILINPIEKLKNAKYYRKMVVRFADLPTKEMNMKTNSPLNKIIEAFGQYEAVNAEIIITVGRAKGNSLYKETVHDSINEIFLNRDLVTKAELTKRDTEDSNVEIIDLFEHKVHDYLTFVLEERQSLDCDYVYIKMAERYLDRRSEIFELINRDE